VSDQVLRETQSTVKMLQEALEKERQYSKTEVERLAGLLNEARDNGSSDEKVKQLEDELKEAQRQVDELTEEMKKPVELEPAIIEKVPEEIEKELSELREKAAQQSNVATLKFKVYFDSLVKGFSDLLGTLTEIKETDQATYDRYKNAVLGLTGKMEERLR
ncbi:MAG: DUF3102 domain-containing protein, partial [Carboxydocellales bacterium]